MPWYRGSTHCHTNESDGDSSPETVIAYHKDSGYNFLVHTDHNLVLDISRFRHLETPEFILIAGEEVTDFADGKPVHINALNPSGVIRPRSGDTVSEAIVRDIAAIEETGALAHVNHPNFYYAITSEDLLAVPGVRMIEMWSGHPEVHNEGDPSQGLPSAEQIWDAVLSKGRRVLGVAVDDAHHFKQMGKEWANPGRGWIVVRAEALSTEKIIAAIAAGDFYASTGVSLKDLQITDSSIFVDVQTAGADTYLIEFVSDGKVASSLSGTQARFELPQNAVYGRVRVTSSDGAQCWTQAVFGQGPTKQMP
ncbi:MAG: CehA/McbA family metallohydrolase [Armatimonadetes bacterium]|nr:CehA/McbA family metallohydrolase [Armatimonadota bacterium]